MRCILAFRYFRDNVNSIAYLLAAVEKSEASRHISTVLISDVSEVLRFSDADVIVLAYSLMTTQVVNLLEEFTKLRELKERLRDKLLLVAGGPHATGDPVGTLDLGFDIVVHGEGEETLPELLSCIVHGLDIAEVRGIWYRDGDRAVFTGYRPKIENLDEYPPYSETHGLYPPIEIMRGCPWGCKYCQTPRIHGFTPRYRSIEYIVKYCRYYRSKGFTHIRFIAPNGFAYGSPDGRKPRPNKLEHLLKSVRETGMKVFLGTFPSEVRPDSVTQEVLDVVSKYVSNRRIALGAQSGSNRVLQLIGRGHTVDDVYRAVDLVIEYGFKPYVDFLFGFPEETDEDLERSMNVIKELVKRGVKIRAHYLLPLPGTPYWGSVPRELPNWFKQFLLRLERGGKLDGCWKEQEELARKIIELERRSRAVVMRVQGSER